MAAPTTSRYRLRQSFRYDYDQPAYSLLHRLVVVPPQHHGDQVLRLGAVRVSDGSAQVSWTGDEHGNRVVYEGGGLLARCLQHESDHLSGRVFGDRLPVRTRKKLHKRHESVAEHYPDDWPVTPATDE